MTLSGMNWHFRSQEIQERFFSVGKGTYLWISAPVREYGSNEVSWAFTFLDFGMCHTVAGCSTVERRLVIPDGVTSHRSVDVYYVDGKKDSPLDEDGAMIAVFAGHHARYVADLYRGLGVSLKFAGHTWKHAASKL